MSITSSVRHDLDNGAQVIAVDITDDIVNAVGRIVGRASHPTVYDVWVEELGEFLGQGLAEAEALELAEAFDLATYRRPLPRNWRRLRTGVLEHLLEHLDDSTEDYELVDAELAGRYAAAGDARVAQAIGAAYGELPS